MHDHQEWINKPRTRIARQRRRFIVSSLDRNGFTMCQICKVKMHISEAMKDGHGKIITIDHNIPRCRGGKDNLNNYLIMCKTCNNKKGGFTMEEFELITKYEKGEGLEIDEIISILNTSLRLKGFKI
jgi:5-methylcytosine-specific restriction endonuclease McrA